MDAQTDGRQPHVVAIVDKIKSEGIFDALRKDCLAEVDLKPAYHNLKQKVEHACANFLSRVAWSTKLNKNQLREQMRRNLEDSGVLQSGVKRIVHQVVSPKVDVEIKPKVAQVVCEYLGLDPDDIHTEDDEHETDGHQQFNQPEAPIGLYPYNPLEAPSVHSEAPPTLPGFEDKLPPASKEEGAPEVRFEEPEGKGEEKSDRQEDMDISDRSDSRSTSRASTKKSTDMDCTMTSDEDESAVNGTDLSKGLAAYMATSTSESQGRNEDDMSISSSDTSSKHESTTPDIGEDSKDSSAISRKKSVEAAPVERREMRRNRTRNKKYMSDDFESIFTANKELLGDTYSQGYVEEEIITTDVTTSQLVEPHTPSTKKRSPHSEEPKTCRQKSPVSSTHSSYNLRGSKNRNGKESTADSSKQLKADSSKELKADSSKELKADSSKELKADSSKELKADSSKELKANQSDGVKVATRASLRRSKSGNQSQESPVVTVPTITPRRYTRSSARRALTPPETAEQEGDNPSSGSTPTQDEPAHPSDSTSTPTALVVLSDICVEVKPSDTALELSAPASRSESAEQADSYEPELHFDELSRDVTEAAPVSGSRSATPTLDEPASPERTTESPISPTSSQSSSLPQLSASLVAIPLNGENNPSGVVDSEASCPPPNLADEAPPLPPGLPPLPSSPVGLRTLTPPEPKCEGEQPPPEPECEGEQQPPPEPECEGEQPPPEPECEGEQPPPEPDCEEEEMVFHVLSEVGADDTTSAADDLPLPEEITSGGEEYVMSETGEFAEQDNYGEETTAADLDDEKELERLAQRKLEILKAIDLPDSALERVAVEPSSEEEEGQITDSSEEDRPRAKKKKSKKSKKKKSKKGKRKHADYDEMGSSSKRSKYY